MRTPKPPGAWNSVTQMNFRYKSFQIAEMVKAAKIVREQRRKRLQIH